MTSLGKEVVRAYLEREGFIVDSAMDVTRRAGGDRAPRRS